MAGAKRRADANRLLRWPWLAAAALVLLALEWLVYSVRMAR